MRFSANAKWMLLGTVCLVAPLAAQAGTSLPDAVGIRPGMTPQEAYNALKAHGNGAKVGIGQLILKGVSEKPVVMIMSVKVMGSSPEETITVWLTPPPNRQQVWGIRRTLQFDEEHEMLKSTVVEGLRQKYGPETSNAGRRSQGVMDQNIHFWMFDEQGGRLDPDASGAHCYLANLMNLSEPQDSVAPQPITPLFSMMPLANGCSDLVSVWTEPLGGAHHGQEYTATVTVIIQDVPLARRSKTAYESDLANADAAKKQQDLDKAKQQKTPAF